VKNAPSTLPCALDASAAAIIRTTYIQPAATNHNTGLIFFLRN
jgi:hypothetical protein